MQRVAVSGASGKTGWRVVEEALQRGMSVRAIMRPESTFCLLYTSDAADE